MKFLNQCAAIGIAATLLASCSQDAPWGVNSGEGLLRLKVEASGDVEAAVPAVRAVSSEVKVPPVTAFGISLEKESGGYKKSWNSIDEFAKEESFPVGKYTLTAYYGNEKSQGQVLSDDLGYEHAQYYGSTPVVIEDGETTEVRLSVELCNAIVVIEYTDAFKNYFKSYKTTVQPSGCEPIELGSNEAMNYVQPGDLSIIMSATQENGKELTLNPGSFTVEPKHMYKLRYNIYNGEIGNAQLAIEFDDSLNEEPLVVNLSEELENTRAPQVAVDGFENGAELATLVGTPYSGTAKFSAIADGGFSSAVLTVNSESYTPSYLANNEIDFCNLTPEQKTAIEADGIKAVGFEQDNTMGFLDLTGLFRKLPEGTHTFTFKVTDKYTQCNEPISCSLSCIPANMSVEGKDALFGEGYADILVRYNGPDPTNMVNNPFSFSVKFDSGNVETCKIKTITLVTDEEAGTEEGAETEDQENSAFPSHNYLYRVSLPYVDKDSFDVDVYFNEITSCGLATINFTYPTYDDNMEYDPMATQIRFRTNFDDEHKKSLIEKRMRVFVGGVEKKADYKQEIMAWVIDGLPSSASEENPSTYEVKTTLQCAATPTEFGSTATITMEQAFPVPNGDFEDLKADPTINTTINQGGTWTMTKESNPDIHQTTLSMTIKEPTSWKSTNAETCNTSATNLNSWYVIPSVYNTTLSWLSHQPKAKFWGVGQNAHDTTADIYKNLVAKSGSNAMVIRNVAWDTNGAELSLDKHTGNTDFSNYYCSNQPSSFANRTAGKIYLVTEDEQGNTVEGVSFVGRPKALKGFYKYTLDSQDPDEKALIKIELLNGDKVIATKSTELGSSSDYAPFHIPLVSDYSFNQRVTNLKISISSSNGTSNIKTTNYCNKEECCSRGATLTIDALTFEY